MTLAWNKNEIGNRRFAPCARPVLLLKFFPGIMVRVMVQKMLPIQFSDRKSGEFCRDVFSPVPLNKFNLTRCGIFRGKILQRKNQNQKIKKQTSKKGRNPRQTQ
ncbi:MAG TPA: hypothetical protein VK840_02985 [Candidatus Dormibacteraeota bacterium]|jgi:hypothetical protein|nr:hypothetical protein [Candidatus Dormibacteraeota bacterium]